jgi:hypothetical protein
MKKLLKERFHHITALTNVTLFSLGLMLLLISISSDNYFIVSEDERAEITKRNEESLTNNERINVQHANLTSSSDKENEEHSPAGLRAPAADYRNMRQSNAETQDEDKDYVRNDLIGERKPQLLSQNEEDMGFPQHENKFIGSIKNDQQNMESVQNALLKNKFMRFKKIKESIEQGTFFQEDGEHLHDNNNTFSEHSFGMSSSIEKESKLGEESH